MKLIALDLDGTLLNGKKEISKNNLSAIRYAQKLGVKVVISSGRNYANVKSICENVNLNTYIISNNGGAIHDNSGKQINSTCISKQEIGKVALWLEKHNYYYEISTNNKIFYPFYAHELLKKESILSQKLNSDKDFGDIDTLPQFKLNCPEYATIKNYKDLLNQEHNYYNILVLSLIEPKLNVVRDYLSKNKSLTLFSSFKNNIELVNSETSKGKALKRLCNLLNISTKEAAAVGDNYNDVSMFKRVGLSVAMGNADKKIKSICKYVTRTNDEDGVAHIIYKLIDENKFNYTEQIKHAYKNAQ